jgi:hypothetical protein
VVTIAVDDGPRGTPGGAGQRAPLQVTGVDDDLLCDLEERVTEFEQPHEPEVLRGGAWVPRPGYDAAVTG